MPARLSSVAFWVVFVAIVCAVAYPELQALREEPPRAAATPAPVALATPPPADRRLATSAPHSHPAVRPHAHPAVASHPRSPAPARPRPLPAPAQAVVAAPPHAVVAEPRRWIPDGDFAFSGRWEHVRHQFDGRTNGSSSRSFHGGATATLSFTGKTLHLYGIVGPRGGLGVVDIDGRLRTVVPFYASVKSVHKLVYSSPQLGPGVHRLTISVLVDPSLQAARSRYVNIGGADV